MATREIQKASYLKHTLYFRDGIELKSVGLAKRTDYHLLVEQLIKPKIHNVDMNRKNHQRRLQFDSKDSNI